jgi:hypothetical protein
MTAPAPAAWMLEQEARAMLRRIDRVKPFALLETMVPAAGLMPVSQVAVERYLLAGRRRLRNRVVEYVGWLHGPGRGSSPEEMQRRFTILRLWFNTALAQLDLFADAISQRSEQETGVWLSGLDVAAQDALTLPAGHFDAPPVVCYLNRGLGGAIRRARTRLPGGGENPVAIIRIPRERMIGYGISSSLVHEVGHQAAALLGLVESLRIALQHRQHMAVVQERPAWRLWERWISEIVADFWAVARIGISSTLGLIGIVSLPRPFVFRVNTDDPHPFPWIRVQLSCAIGNALYPHPQWARLAGFWESLYPAQGLEGHRARIVACLQATMPSFVSALVAHRPPSLQGRALGPTLTMSDRAPARLDALLDSWRRSPDTMRHAAPTLVFAALGRARITGRLTPEQEDRALGRLLTHWALHSTLSIAEVCATQRTSSPATEAPGIHPRPPLQSREPVPTQ